MARNQDYSVIPRVLGKDKVPIEQLNSNPTNRVKTTRYNWFTFLPITMFLQFTRVVNIYYLFNGLLQMIPAVSTNKPIATFIPLSFVIMVGIIKEMIVEIKRGLDDKALNKTVYKKLLPLDEQD